MWARLRSKKVIGAFVAAGLLAFGVPNAPLLAPMLSEMVCAAAECGE